MKIAYLLNSYPMTSTTFIRREIHAIERSGTEVVRYAIREWDTPLIDPADHAEQTRTTYLLSVGAGRLAALALREAARNPWRLLGAIGLMLRLIGHARGRLVHHVAYLLEAIRLRGLAAQDGVAHIHAHFSTNAAAVAMLAHRLGGPPYSFTAHGPDEFVDWPRGALAEEISRARFVAAISHFCRAQLLLAAGMAARDKIHIVRCGVDLSEFAVSDASFEDNPRFVCVGRLCRQKAQVLIAEAVGRVARDHPEIRMIFIGGGEAREALEATVARLGIDEQVTLTGWADTETVRAELGRARALALPSLAEGLPVVIMEALALGRPALSTYIAGIPELVDSGCGWIIPAASVGHIEAALRAALETPPDQLAAMGREGRARVERDHDQAANAARLLDLIRRYAETGAAA